MCIRVSIKCDLLIVEIFLKRNSYQQQSAVVSLLAKFLKAKKTWAVFSFIFTDSLTRSLSIVVLVGDMGAGKSNILQRYHKGVFTRMASTIGVEFLTKRIVLPDHPLIKA